MKISELKSSFNKLFRDFFGTNRERENLHTTCHCLAARSNPEISQNTAQFGFEILRITTFVVLKKNFQL
jgi:hypothetical protein